MISIYIGGFNTRHDQKPERYSKKRMYSTIFFQESKILHLKVCVHGKLSNKRFENQIESQVRYGSQ